MYECSSGHTGCEEESTHYAVSALGLEKGKKRGEKEKKEGGSLFGATSLVTGSRGRKGGLGDPLDDVLDKRRTRGREKEGRGGKPPTTFYSSCRKPTTWVGRKGAADDIAPLLRYQLYLADKGG